MTTNKKPVWITQRSIFVTTTVKINIILSLITGNRQLHSNDEAVYEQCDLLLCLLTICQWFSLPTTVHGNNKLLFYRTINAHHRSHDERPSEVPRQSFHVICLSLCCFYEPEKLKFADGTHEPCSVQVAGQRTQPSQQQITHHKDSI